MSTEPAIHRIITGSYQVNTYIVSCPETGLGIIIDPGGAPKAILQYVSDKGLTIPFILNTHGHADHIIANEPLKKALELQVCMHEADDVFFTRPDILKIEEKQLGLAAPGKADRRLKDGDVIDVGTMKIRVIHTPGHSPGSACFLVEGNLFTGDTLFVGDVGRTDLVGGSFDTLLRSIKEKIIVLPGETKVWPGHDYGEMPTSTLAWELEENPYITEFILAGE